MNDLNVRIRPLHISTFVEKLKNQDFFAFQRLLHGFWDQLYFYTKSNTYEKLLDELNTSSLKKCSAIWCHRETMELLRNPLEHVIWGIYPAGNSGQKIIKKSVQKINLVLDKNHVVYDGTIWKNAIINNEIGPFIKEINRYKVVIVGMDCLRRVRHLMGLKNSDFLQVEPLVRSKNVQIQTTSTLQDLREKWLDYHDKLNGEPVVYLTQLSYGGAPIVGGHLFENAFVFDVGVVLNLWSGGLARSYPWEKAIPEKPKISNFIWL